MSENSAAMDKTCQERKTSGTNKSSIIFSILLIAVGFLQYNEYINRVELEEIIKQTRQRKSVPDYYDLDLDDDLEMATSTVYSTTTGNTPGKLTFNPRVVLTTPATPIDADQDANDDKRSKDDFSLLKISKTNQKCVAPADIDWSSSVDPIYKLNPNKFLIPALIWGPMNQVEGLRESIAIAISLNRTLVLPPMFRHFTDPDGPNGLVDSDIRVDIPSIRNLLSVTSYKALGLKPDGVLYARTIGFGSTANDNGSKGLVTSNSRIGRLKKFERATGYTVLADNLKNPSATNDFFEVDVTPKNAKFDEDVRLDYEGTNWNQIFGSNNKYEVLLFPYLTAKLETQTQTGRNIMQHTLRPAFVHSMVDDFFTSHTFPKTFVTIHYRFDEEDWERSCNKKRPASTSHEARYANREKICSLIANNNGSDGLAASLASFLVELFSLNEIGDEVAFYIATPPQQQEIIKETTQKTIELVKKQIGHKVSVSGKSTADTTSYITDTYDDCDFVENNMHELSSLFEQEVCSRGQVFIFAPSSSWSGAVRKERHAIHHEHHNMVEHSLIDILENYPKDETRLLDAALERRKLK